MFSRSHLLSLRAGLTTINNQFLSRARPGTIISHAGPLSKRPSDYYHPIRSDDNRTGQQQQQKVAGSATDKDTGADDDCDFLTNDGSGANRKDSSSSKTSSSSSLVIEPSEMFAGDKVWSSSNTIGESWKNLHDIIANNNGSNEANIINNRSTGEDLDVDADDAVEDTTENSNNTTTVEKLLLENDLRALSQVTSRAEISHLLHEVMPESLRARVIAHPSFNADSLEEIFLHLGMDVELRSNTRTIYKVAPPTAEEISFMCKRIGSFGDDGRACVNNTLHRVSCWMSRSGHTVGLTIRIGRFVPFAASSFLHAAIKGSLLLLSPPSCGKTTCLRDLATQLARLPQNFRVVVIDTSNEIGGDSEVPLPYLHRVRRLQVPRRSLQLNYMIQAVQNHAPDFVIIDEIASKAEAECAVSMSQRGIRLVATAHASTLHSLLQNSELNPLVGGVAHAFLSNEERRLRKKQKKTILERMSSSPFRTVVELQGRNNARIIRHVNDCVDLILDTGSLDGADVSKNWVSENVKLDDPSDVIEQQEIDLKRDVEQEIIATTENTAPHLPPPKSASATSNNSNQAENNNREPREYYSNNSNNNNMQNVTCYRCGEKGHKANNCPAYERMKQHTTSTHQNNENNNKSRSHVLQQYNEEKKSTKKKSSSSSSSPSDGLFVSLDDNPELAQSILSKTSKKKNMEKKLSSDTTDDNSSSSTTQWWDKLENETSASSSSTDEEVTTTTADTNKSNAEVFKSIDELLPSSGSPSSPSSSEKKYYSDVQWWHKLEGEAAENIRDVSQGSSTGGARIVRETDDETGYFDIKEIK